MSLAADSLLLLCKAKVPVANKERRGDVERAPYGTVPREQLEPISDIACRLSKRSRVSLRAPCPLQGFPLSPPG